MECPYCGFENKSGMKFCNGCGGQLLFSIVPVKCPYCGFENSEGAKFCNECGKNLVFPNVRNSNMPIRNGNVPKMVSPSANVTQDEEPTEKFRRGTSNSPVVLGVLGGLLGLPSSACSGACAAMSEGIASSGGVEVSGVTEFYLYGTAITSIALVVTACFTKSTPIIAGLLMIITSLFTMVLFGVTANMLGIIAMILTLLGGILSITQKKEYV